MDKKVLWFGRDEIKYPITCGIESGRYVFRDADENEIAWLFELNTVVKIANELSQLRAERDALKARVEARDKLINVMAPMHQLTCRNHKSCPICKAYDKYSKEIDGESVDTTPGGDE